MMTLGSFFSGSGGFELAARYAGIETLWASEVRFWMGVWAQHWKLVDSDKGVKLPKDEKAVRRWLKSKPTDSGIYRMWGNGIALPCATYVMEGIAEILKEDISDDRQSII